MWGHGSVWTTLMCAPHTIIDRLYILPSTYALVVRLGLCLTRKLQELISSPFKASNRRHRPVQSPDAGSILKQAGLNTRPLFLLQCASGQGGNGSVSLLSDDDHHVRPRQPTGGADEYIRLRGVHGGIPGCCRRQGQSR